MNYHLSVDIGASGGKVFLGAKVDGKIKMEEIHRFENGMYNKDGNMCWDIENLLDNIIISMKYCNERGQIPTSIGIDTWGVDFALIDKEGNLLGDFIAYRDKRTSGTDLEIEKLISDKDLYARTGIQKQIFNTIYQLFSIKDTEEMSKAASMLMIPDYINYRLTGNISQEYTNATTTGLVNIHTSDWDYELIEKLGIKKEIFSEIKMPKSLIGRLKPEIEEEVGFNCDVVSVCSHDTASAVLAVPSSNNHIAYISSGTWSLIGMESREYVLSEESMIANFTNEGGYHYRYRYLKNIMGLWMIQNIKKEFDDIYTFGEIADMASKSDCGSIVDCNDDRFLAPDSMCEEIKNYCEETGQYVPLGIGEIANVVYRSLADAYSKALDKIEVLSGNTYDSLFIVGGGAQADFLNKLTAKYTKRTVYAGPIEATAIGNLLTQMLRDQEFENVEEARACVMDSFDIKKYESK